jgi:hypothetical protein
MSTTRRSLPGGEENTHKQFANLLLVTRSLSSRGIQGTLVRADVATIPQNREEIKTFYFPRILLRLMSHVLDRNFNRECSPPGIMLNGFNETAQL